ncbi:MAG: class I tRNA ligase family protein, partial [Bacteroidia bacterium]
GRFGNWLENLVDWNLSRSRYWGIPLPIWRTEDRKQEKCIGSIAELKAEIEKAVAAGFMKSSPYQSEDYDLHRPYIDKVILVSETGEKMYRETDLIDVWFDSGSMPFAQWHYPFENQALFNANYPADFIAEGVDQTRGWFFTLHAISVMLEDSVAFKNVIANGLVLDEKGEKMSKSKGNVVNPFLAIDTYGADAVRWYMIANSDPWENLKFSWKKKNDKEKREGKWKDLPEYSPAIEETIRAFFGTLYNTYNFFALYANVDSFEYGEKIAVSERSELDRWVISCLNTLVKKVDAELADYEPTRTVRLIEEFVTESLSNWYVRLSRRVFWKGELNQDKIAAYQTLYECLQTISILMSAFAPFYAEKVYRDLTGESVHLADFPAANEADIDLYLEEKMEAAQRISSLTHSIRKKVNIKVRQPLQKILIPILEEHTKTLLEGVKDIILSEVNVKELAYITDDDSATVLVKKAKPNFKLLGPKLGGLMKEVGAAVNNFSQNDIRSLEVNQKFPILLSNGTNYDLLLSEIEITSQDVEGWSVTTDGKFTVALDIHLSESLKNEGVARELVNRIQNLRKNQGFDLTDTISIQIESKDLWNQAFDQFKEYICAETLCQELIFVEELQGETEEIEVFDVVGKIVVKQLAAA